MNYKDLDKDLALTGLEVLMLVQKLELREVLFYQRD